MTALAFRKRSGTISRPRRKSEENPYLEAVAELVPGSDEGVEVDLTYADALEAFPTVTTGKDADGEPIRRPATREEAISKLLAKTRRQLTEAGNEADPPITVYWDGGVEQEDGETVTVFFKAAKGKIVRKD